jgi:ABC-type arginine transport system permease subunit
MTMDFDRLLADFLPQLLAGMAVNFEIAAISLLLGLAVGLILTLGRLAGGVVGGASASLTALMRAAPTFVVMFFLLNAIPRDATLFGVPVAVSGLMAVALSLLPYAAAYVADSAFDAVQEMRKGSPLGALLLLPNLARAFFVLVMSSSAGAAIGVGEGIAVILRHAEQYSMLGDRLLLFAFGVACFGIPLQLGFALIRGIQRRLGRRMTRGRADPV